MATTTLMLEKFGDPNLDATALLGQLLTLRERTAPRLARYLGYYRNRMIELYDLLPYGTVQTALSLRPYRQYQEMGLPQRITGLRYTCTGEPVLSGPLEAQRKEVVIENDIAWRINTLVDFALGQMPGIVSTARDPALRERITAALGAVLAANGGLAFLQQLTLLGALQGSVYVLLHPSQEVLTLLAGRGDGAATPTMHQSAPSVPGASAGLSESVSAPALDNSVTAADPRIVAAVRLELVEAGRVLALPPQEAPLAVAGLRYAAILHEDAAPAGGSTACVSAWRRMARWLIGDVGLAAEADPGLSLDVWGSDHWQRYVSGALVDEGANPLGFVPVVAFINQVAPLAPGSARTGLDAAGLSEVEPLIGMQDELNTRLSDRANRVTMQSFPMYLAKGVEDFLNRPVGPGQMWSTDNLQASVESFGGDAAAPSEVAHIAEVRAALDKISGVPPVAAGLLQGKVGNLTSAVALRLTLIGVLSRTEKRRAALGQMLDLLARHLLAILDRAELLHTSPEDRGTQINWPSALPDNDTERLQDAQLKVALGVKPAVVLEELGYRPEEMV